MTKARISPIGSEEKSLLILICPKQFWLNYNDFLDIISKATVQKFYDVGLLIDLKMKVKTLRTLVFSKTDEKLA